LELPSVLSAVLEEWCFKPLLTAMGLRSCV
jgi:hypothetical protein